MAAFGAVYEDEDDWLVGYLASTEYGADTRINSNPTASHPKKEKPPPKLYNLSHMLVTNPSRRNSWAAPEGKSRSRKSFQSEATSLPERVNSVRETAFVPGGNMVVSNHGKSEIYEAGKRPSMEEDEEAWADEELAKIRRQSLDYDELEAVKERVMQATSVWKKADSPMNSKRVSPVDSTPSEVVKSQASHELPVEKTSKSSNGPRNWLVSKWMSKFGGQKSRTG